MREAAIVSTARTPIAVHSMPPKHRHWESISSMPQSSERISILNAPTISFSARATNGARRVAIWAG